MSTIIEQVKEFFLTHEGKYQINDISEALPHIDYDSLRGQVSTLHNKRFIVGDKAKGSKLVSYYRPLDFDRAFKQFLMMKPTETKQYRHR